MDNSEKRINELQTILEITKLLNSSNNVEYILESMMSATLQLLDRADIGVVFLYDKNDDILRLQTSFGFHDMDLTLKPGESITGTTFKLKKTLHLKNRQEMLEIMVSMENRNRDYLNANIIEPMDRLQSSISCPLMHNDECIGVFVLDNYLGKEALSEDDVYLAELISLHATIAIVNAESYKKEIENQKRLKKYSQLVEEEKERYEYSTYLHNKFTEMVLNGSSISDILKDVSLILNRDIFTVDLLNNISEFSLGLTATIDQLKDEKSTFTSRLSVGRTSKFYCEESFGWIFFNPIRVNQEILGWVGVISDSKIYNELERIAIDKCSTITALEMLKNDDLSNMEQSLKGDFLDNLLAGKPTDFSSKFAQKYSYNFDKHHQIIIVKIDFENIEASLHKNLRYLYLEVNKLVMKEFFNCITLQKGNYIITIFEQDSRIEKDRIVSLIKKINDKSKYVFSLVNRNFKCRIAVSEVIKNSTEFKMIYDNTFQLFNLDINDTEDFKYYFYEDLEIKRFLLKNDREELESFVDKVLGPLLEYNNTSRNDLFDTLKMYIVTNGNWTLTKDSLHIHGNTLTYRINRLKEILGCDFNEYRERFKIQIALEILDISSNKQPH